jgi:succinate dehydrogenase / fumarate reductase flavoprotein subunit
MTTVKGLYALGEANFSDHGANRLGASALMQGLADGYYVIPYTLGVYLSDEVSRMSAEKDKADSIDKLKTKHPAFDQALAEQNDRINKFLNIKGTKSVESFHKRLGLIMWNKCGMARNKQGLTEAIAEIQALRKEFWSDVRVLGTADEFNPDLEKAGRVADFLELGELMCKDALHREESCGGHFREEHQTEDGEAKRDDVNFAYVAAWEYKEVGNWELNKEELKYENIKIAQRSYK